MPMERSEPALAPEWLRSTGSVNGSGSLSHRHTEPSALHSDGSSSSLSTRNRPSRGISDKDSQLTPFLDRISSSNSRRSSNSSSSKHPYSSFTRSHRDKNRDREKERSAIGDLWDHDSSDPFGNVISSRVDKISLRRSVSLVSRRPVELVASRGGEDLKSSGNNNQSTVNGMLFGGNNHTGIRKSSFEKDFPSLGSEETQGVSGIGRVTSPVLSTAVQNLPIGNSGLLGGEKWTSALAEVPSVVGSNGIGNLSPQLSIGVTPASGVSNVSGLNMAEALSQPLMRSRPTPQVPDKTQRLEELAKKQSRQLIPMTPSMPKALVSNSLEKVKQPRAGTRTEVGVSSKNVQQQLYSSQIPNHSRGVQLRSGATNSSQVGKFLVLKPTRENGGTSVAKDGSSSTGNNVGRVANPQPAGAPSSSTVVTSPNVVKVSSLESKLAAQSLNLRPTTEKRSSAQSRNAFFNLVRKKTIVNSSSVLPNSNSNDSSTNVFESDEIIKDVASAPESPHSSENCSQISRSGESRETYEEIQRNPDDVQNNSCLNGAVDPDEEEAAFLRSLGWEENSGEDEGLTEEEINAFYQEYMKLKPSLKGHRGLLPKCLMPPEMNRNTNSGSVSSGSSSSESET